MNERRHSEQDMLKFSSNEKSETGTLEALLKKMQAEREALGQIDSVQLTDDDLERMAELDENIIVTMRKLGIQNIEDETIH